MDCESKLIFRHRPVLMSLSALAIVLYHQRFVHFPLLSIFQNFGLWGVDCFFFLSGMGISLSLQKNSYSRFYIRRAIKLLPAWLACVLVVVFLCTTATPIKLPLINNVISAVLYFWFVIVIIAYYAASPLLDLIFNQRKVIENILLPVSFFIFAFFTLILCLYYDFNDSKILLWATSRFPEFILGFYMTRFQSLGMLYRKPWLPCICLLIAACCSWIARHNEFYAWDIPIYIITCIEMFQYIFLCLAMPFICHKTSLLAESLQRSHLYKMVAHLSSITLELYMVHIILFREIYKESKLAISVHISPVLDFLLYVMLSIILSYLLHFVCSLFQRRIEAFLPEKSR